MTKNALSMQFGGSHYQNKAVQPVEFGMVNCLDDCAFSTLKYVTRHKEKAGELDLRKAHHFVELREALARNCHRVTKWPISMAHYCRANELPPAETEILMMLADYVASNDPIYARMIKAKIEDLIFATYVTPYSTQE